MKIIVVTGQIWWGIPCIAPDVDAPATGIPLISTCNFHQENEMRHGILNPEKSRCLLKQYVKRMSETRCKKKPCVLYSS